MIMTTTEVCTTQEAAQILGISVTSVQQLVEAGVIDAWKTKGGHRRIPMAAVEAYKSHPNAPADGPPKIQRKATVSILVVEDNKMHREIYANKMAAWNLPATTTFCENGYQALVEIASNKPDIVLADIVMEGIDGYEIVTTILSYPTFSDINIAIISSLPTEELEARGGIPDGVVFFQKPVNYDELSGYLRACCAQKAQKARQART